MANNIKIVDVIEEGKQEENESVKPIPEETKNEAVIEQPPEERDEIVSAPPEQPKPEPKKKEPPIAIDQPVKQNVRQQDKLVKCPQCDKQMKLKSFRYKHELTCKGKLEDIPRKPTQPVSNQILKPQTPNLVDFASHYQLLQNQIIQQKKEKYNNLCQNMFASRSKKR